MLNEQIFFLKEVSTPVHRQRKFNFDAPVATFLFSQSHVQEQITEYNPKIVTPFPFETRRLITTSLLKASVAH